MHRLCVGNDTEPDEPAGRPAHLICRAIVIYACVAAALWLVPFVWAFMATGPVARIESLRKANALKNAQGAWATLRVALALASRGDEQGSAAG